PTLERLRIPISFNGDRKGSLPFFTVFHRQRYLTHSTNLNQGNRTTATLQYESPQQTSGSKHHHRDEQPAQRVMRAEGFRQRINRDSLFVSHPILRLE